MIPHSGLRSWKYAVEGFGPALEKILRRRGDLPGQVIYRTGHKECLLLSGDFTGMPYRVVFKRYRDKRLWQHLLRSSPAYREYCGFALTSAAGIPVAEVLAVGEIRRCGHLVEAFFVTRFEEGAESGFDFQQGERDEARLDEFVRLNLALLAKLHSAGLIHGGFHPRNELYRIGEDGRMSVVWLDLATVKEAGRRSAEKDRREDLTRFLREFAFPPERERGYREYYAAKLGGSDSGAVSKNGD